MRIARLFLFSLVTLLAIGSALAESGRIDGRVTSKDGKGRGGVSVVVAETRDATVTDAGGYYSFGNLAAGKYTLLLTQGDHNQTLEGVTVTSNSRATADVEVDWDLNLVESLTVFSASRRIERIVEAPAAITTITEDQIEQQAAHGQLPKLIEFTPGTEVTQSGLYDYNVNTRGFNSSLNRRVATLIDGRDPSAPFLGAQEWPAISFPLDDLASVEMIRGPSAALYGANASSGVLNMTTKQPRYSEGGLLRLTLGELSTVNADVRWAGSLGNDWYVKLAAGIRESGDFSVSRDTSVEYSVPCTMPGQTGCLPLEAPLAIVNDNEISIGGVRIDKYLKNGAALTFEGGWADISGPLFQTGIGRVQLVDVERPWLRFNFNTNHWNVLAYYNKREAPTQLGLASGANLALDTDNLQIEAQTNWDFLGDKLRIVAGASYGEENIDTEDPTTGRQTLTFASVESDSLALFAQLDYSPIDKIKLVLAARFDDSSLHDSELSPKGSLVYSMDPNHSLRLTYNEAFQVANYSEFFLFAPVAAPAGTAALEGICLLSGVTDCGLVRIDTDMDMAPDSLPVLALGNEDLELEKIKTFELGYTGIIGGSTFLTAEYYNSKADNFITDLLPQSGTSLGMVNPNYGFWTSATADSAPVNPMLGFPTGFTVGDAVRFSAAGAFGALGAQLSNDPDGNAIVAARSYTNFGEVDTQGVDIGFNHYLGDNYVFSLSYSWFDFDIKNNLPGFDELLLPNSPEHKGVLGFQYNGDRHDIGLSYRWSDSFHWAVGPFNGPVDSYRTLDINANIRISDNWSLGANIANALDHEHIEAFGGDILGRRGLLNCTYTWGPEIGWK